MSGLVDAYRSRRLICGYDGFIKVDAVACCVWGIIRRINAWRHQEAANRASYKTST